MNRYLINAAIGVLVGLVVGLLLGSTRSDICQARVSSQHVSICLDSKIDKAKALFR
ncbi:hypothetical protein J4G48_0040390 [Bradyrhizobium barranii subsp. apii]|uniref:hypothetical protein n=1 Tax=Bradyrhizobium barranii TaxID=2992140 RepID=UPI001AA19A43|nr:hypothetical protein [Bradyrhizobium barranii]UPT95417.1 hypothetical protein J4G48_0040390 [Bradyrhizobium barranii subsp. apii]